MMNALNINIPLFLTFIRLIVSPFLLPILFSVFLPLKIFEIDCIIALIFILLSFTDFLDGFIARKFKQETELGSILDPIADKFHLFSVLITLVYLNKVYFYWALIFIGREFFIMALRQIALSNGFNLKVNSIAKWKTFFQMAYLAFVILNSVGSLGFGFNIFDLVELLLLIIALYMTIFSAVQYYITFIKCLRA